MSEGAQRDCEVLNKRSIVDTSEKGTWALKCKELNDK